MASNTIVADRMNKVSVSQEAAIKAKEAMAIARRSHVSADERDVWALKR